MSGFYGYLKPLVYLVNANDPTNLNTHIHLPDPSAIEPLLEKESRQVKTSLGRIFTKRVGYRQGYRLTWTNVSDADFSNMNKIANWPGIIIFIPHSDQSLIGFTAEPSLSHEYPGNRSTHIDTVTMEFIAVDVGPILDYDNLLNAEDGYFCNDNPVVLPPGTEKIVNGSFTVWAGGHPVNWTVTGNDAFNDVVEDTQKARIFSNNTSRILIKQNVLPTVGGIFILTLDVITVVSGRLVFNALGGGPVGDVDLPIFPGHYCIYFTATSSWFEIARKGVCNVTIDNVSIKQVTLNDLQLTLDEAIFN